MSEASTYSFLPWLRKGIANKITATFSIQVDGGYDIIEGRIVERGYTSDSKTGECKGKARTDEAGAAGNEDPLQQRDVLPKGVPSASARDSLERRFLVLSACIDEAYSWRGLR